MHEINVDPSGDLNPGIVPNVSSPFTPKPPQTSDKISLNHLSDAENIKPNKKYVSFREAHEFAKSLSLKTRKEWRLYVKDGLEGKVEKPKHIPAHPDGIYKVKGWQGWKYWLGTADKGLF